MHNSTTSKKIFLSYWKIFKYVLGLKDKSTLKRIGVKTISNT